MLRMARLPACSLQGLTGINCVPVCVRVSACVFMCVCGGGTVRIQHDMHPLIRKKTQKLVHPVQALPLWIV